MVVLQDCIVGASDEEAGVVYSLDKCLMYRHHLLGHGGLSLRGGAVYVMYR